MRRVCCYRRYLSSKSNIKTLDFDEIPSPKGLPFIGTTLSLLMAGGPTKLHKYIDQRHNALGPIFKDNVGPVKAVFLSDAQQIRHVFAKEGKYPVHIKPESWLIFNEKHNCSRGLFFMDGEQWLRHRRIMNNLMLKGDLCWLETACQIASDLFVDKISTKTDVEFTNLEAELYKWSMNVVVAVLIGPESFIEYHREFEDLIEELASKVFMIFETTVGLQLIPAKLAEKLQLNRWKSFEKSVKDCLNITDKIINRIRLNLPRTDGLVDKMTKSGIDKSNIDNIVVDLMLGAGDTTTSTMSWSLYLLAKNPTIQQQINKNLNGVKNVVKESLRLYPPAAFLTRFLPDQTTISRYKIPSKTLIVMSIYTCGRDENYFKNPLEFMPNRWDRNEIGFNDVNEGKISAGLPFGLGSRSCIGRKIAENQLQDTLKKIVENYVISLCDKTSEVEDISKMILKPATPIRLIFTKR